MYPEMSDLHDDVLSKMLIELYGTDRCEQVIGNRFSDHERFL